MTTTVQTTSATPSGAPPSGSASSGDAAPPAARPRAVDTPAIPLTRLVRVELRKMVDTRSGLGLLAAILLIDLIAVGIVSFADATSTFGFEAYLAILMNVQMVLLPIVGVLAASAEWSQRTTLQTFALEPRRSRVVLAKILSALVLMVLITVASIAFSAAGHGLSLLTGNVTEGWGLSWPIMGGMLAFLTLITLMGVAFGLLLHAPAVAIVAFLLLPQVFSVIPLILPRLADAFGWIDFQLAWSVLYMDGAITGGGWARILVTSVIWVVLPLVAGWYRTVRREAA